MLAPLDSAVILLSIPQKSHGSFSKSLWILGLTILPFLFPVLKARVSLGKVVKQHPQCEMPALTVNVPVSKQQRKTPLGFIVASDLGDLNKRD